MIQPITNDFFGDFMDDRLAAELEKQDEFLAVLKEVDTYLQSQKKTVAEKRREQAEAAEKKAREKKMDELRMMISKLRGRVMMGEEGAQGYLAVLEGELLMMQLFG